MTYERRNMNEENYGYFKFLHQKESWESVLNCTNVDEAYEKFIENYSHYFNIAFPIKKCKTNKRNNSNKTWINNEVEHNSEMKRFYFDMLCKYPDSNSINICT